MKKKKIVFALLAGTMVLTMLAGCGKKKDKEEGGDNSTAVVDDMIAKYNPLVELPEYKGLEYKPQVTEITDDMVQARVDQLVSSATVTENATEGEAKMGDTVNIDFVGYIDGVAFSGGDTMGQGTNITLGSSGYIANFDDQIVGHKPGDTFDVKVKFPDDYGNADLNGKDAVFETTLNYIVNETVPELNDEFIKNNTDYDTVDAYKESVRKELTESYAQSDESTNKDTLLNIVIERCNFSGYPETELEERVQQTIDRYSDMAQANDMDMETLLSSYGLDADTFQSQVRAAVEDMMKERIAVVAIAAKEGITVTKGEEELAKQTKAADYGVAKVEDLEAYGITDEDIYFDELEKKVLQVLLDNAVDNGEGSSESVTEAATTEASTTEAATTEAATEEATTEAASEE